MKNKAATKQSLNADLVKYCKQIGIVDCEIPELLFSKEEFDSKDKEVEDRLHLDIAERRGNRILGMSSISRRAIYVRMDRAPSKIWRIRRTKRYIYQKHVAWGLREARRTMIHELVHYRFPYMKHGRKFGDRITDILRGKEYPRKHIVIPAMGYE